MPVTISSLPATTPSSTYSTYNSTSGVSSASSSYARGRSPSVTSASRTRFSYPRASLYNGGGDDSAAPSAGHTRFGQQLHKPPTGSTSSATSSRCRTSTTFTSDGYGTGGRASLSRYTSSNGSSSSNGYHRQDSPSNDHYTHHHLSHNHHNHNNVTSSKRHTASTLTATGTATQVADLYAKYSPTNYKPNTELSRSRSLSEGSRLALDSGSGVSAAATAAAAATNKASTNGSGGSGATNGGNSSSSSGGGAGLNGGRLHQLHHYGSQSPSRAVSRDRDLADASTALITSKVRNASLRNSAAVGGATSLKSTSPSRYSTTGTGNGGSWDRDARSSLLNGRTQSDSVASAGASGGLELSAPTTSYLRSSAGLYGDRGSADDSDGLCGLRNIGNTCFMNSVIQCLSHTRELTDYLRESNDTRSTTKDQRIFYEFAKLIREMWQPRQRTVTPSELKSAVSSKHRMYSGCAQQDAQEFLRFFLDSLHNASNTGVKGAKLEIDESLPDQKQADVMWTWFTRVDNSVVQDLFVGQFKSSLRCTVCGNTSVTFDPFWDLSVPLQSSTRCKLESCLDFFIKEEVLDGDEMPTCSKCKTRRKSTKSFTIQRFPKYLVIHLKRFSETRWSKLTNTVEFPTGENGLDMAPYAASGVSAAKYTLYGISNHMGSTAGGHYVALCKHPVTKKWHEFNDNIVSDASESQLVSSSAYLLFYERA